MTTRNIIEKWYKKLGFDQKYDNEFYSALDEYKIDESAMISDYDLKCEDGRKNFLYFLFFCEETERIYKQMGIDEEILLDTLADIPRWLDTWSELKGSLYLGELDWLSYHLSAKLFKLGRLQFCFAHHYEFSDIGVKKGDNVIDTHIPAAGPLDEAGCIASFRHAKEFFAKFFPDYKWDVFTCHSWLLAGDMTDILPHDSNILKFQRLYTITDQYESDAIIRYTLQWKLQREDVGKIEPTSRFGRLVKELALTDRVFHGGTGYIKKEEI